MKYLFLLLVLLPTACTSVLWNGGVYDADRAINVSSINQSTETDRIGAFIRIPEYPNESFSGSLMLLGERYWYAVHQSVSSNLTATLQAPLPRHYHITQPYTGALLTALPIRINAAQQFSSEFCLDYHVNNEQSSEITILRQLHFQEQYHATHYRKCFAITGRRYAPNATTNAQFFRQPFPVVLTLQRQRITVQNNKLVRNILLTPFSVALDIAGSAVMLPILIVSDLF